MLLFIIIYDLTCSLLNYQDSDKFSTIFSISANIVNLGVDEIWIWQVKGSSQNICLIFTDIISNIVEMIMRRFEQIPLVIFCLAETPNQNFNVWVKNSQSRISIIQNILRLWGRTCHKWLLCLFGHIFPFKMSH